MFVAASTESFQHLPLGEALERLADLEFTSVEVLVRPGSLHLDPAQIAGNLDAAVVQCRNTQRLDVVAFYVDLVENDEPMFDQFTACCKLAKATKVVSMVVPSAERGSPFNEEVERLRRMVSIATREGVVLGLKTQIGRHSQDPSTVAMLCSNVPGLGVTLDPSHYICGPSASKRYDDLYKLTTHVHLRDTTKTQLQVRVGQGEIEYGKVISMLRKVKYNRALCVNILESEGIDPMSELRKLRLLLESLL